MFKLACITKRIQDLVVITRLLTVFDTYESVAEAVGAAPAYVGLKASQPPSSMPLGATDRFLGRA